MGSLPIRIVGQHCHTAVDTGLYDLPQDETVNSAQQYSLYQSKLLPLKDQYSMIPSDS